jgi:L-seryl-tRNA(Ser) seleniumtransferase
MNRRELFRRGTLLAGAPALLQEKTAQAAPGMGLRIGPEIYQSIGVRPIINCRGTLTVVGGSLELPEVKAAKEAAANHYVHIDEMMEGIGKRLAELTGAEWGMVSSGCAAGVWPTPPQPV